MAAKKPSPGRPARSGANGAYTHLQPRHARDLGSTLDHAHSQIPSSNFRRLEDEIPAASIRTQDHYKFSPRTGKLKVVPVREDVLHHAQRMGLGMRGQYPAATSGYRERYRKQESAGEADQDMGAFPVPLPQSALAGQMKRKPRY